MHKTKFLLLSTILIATTVCVGIYLYKNKTNNINGLCFCDGECTSQDNMCRNSTDLDTGDCENENIYLSYISDPCSVNTPMTGKNCTCDDDCVGAGWADPTGCCDTYTGKCKSWIWDETTLSPHYICPTNYKSCKKNSDCNNGEFCNLVSSEYDSEKPDTGNCTPLGDSTIYTYINGTDKTFLVSSIRLTWWSAENWCQAQGKNLLSETTLQTLFDCDKSTNSCDWDKFENESNWQDGQVLTDYYCTSKNYNSNDAWIVLVHAHFFHNYGRDVTSYVLCE